MDNLENLKSTILFLNSQVIVPTIDEVFRFFQSEIDRESFENLINEGLDAHVIYKHNDYLGTDLDLNSLVEKRVDLENSIKPYIRDLKKRLEKPNKNIYLVIVGYKNNRYCLRFLSAKNSDRIIKFKYVRHFGKLDMDKVEIEIISEISQENRDRKTEDFYILNSSILYNSEKLFESLVGAVLFNNQFFPNYPINALSGVKLRNRLEFNKKATSKDSKINHILKLIGY